MGKLIGTDVEGKNICESNDALDNYDSTEQRDFKLLSDNGITPELMKGVYFLGKEYSKYSDFHIAVSTSGLTTHQHAVVVLYVLNQSDLNKIIYSQEDSFNSHINRVTYLKCVGSGFNDLDRERYRQYYAEVVLPNMSAKAVNF